MDRRGRADALLVARGAADVAHPGGTLLAHLRRVADRLASWGADEDVQLAGLCHAAYGTDGFPVALLGLSERDLLRGAVGERAERLVHAYGTCDRSAVYPQLGGSSVVMGGADVSGPDLRAFVEITAANELDVVEQSVSLAVRHGAALKGLVVRAERHLSPAAVAAWGAWEVPGGVGVRGGRG